MSLYAVRRQQDITWPAEMRDVEELLRLYERERKRRQRLVKKIRETLTFYAGYDIDDFVRVIDVLDRLAGIVARWEDRRRRIA